MNKNYLNIPVSLCYLAFERKCIAQFQLFCWLKLQCSGNFKLTNQVLHAAYKQLSITKPTFQKRLKWLVVKKWIGLNNKTKGYHINSFKVIHRRTRSNNKTGILWDEYNFRNFKAFVNAAVLFDLAAKKLWHERKKLKEEGRIVVKVGMLKGHSNSCISLPSFPLPLVYAAKKLNKPVTYITRMKSAAKCADFICVKKCRFLIESDYQKFDFVKEHHPAPHKLIVWRKKLYEQMPDKITFIIYARKKRSLKHI